MALQQSWPGPDNVTDQTEARKDFAGLIVRDTSGNARPGIFPRKSDGSAIVTARSDMALDIAAFEGATVRGGGPLLQANDGVAQSALLTSPPANSQYYILMFKQNESASPYSDANDNAVFPLYQGAASGSPVLATDLAAAIAANPGAHPLAAILMPTGKTATNQVGVVITQLFDYTALAQGVIQVRNDTELQALTQYAEGLVGAYRLDIEKEYVRRSGKWVPKYLEETIVPTVANTGGAATLNSDGSVSFSGAITLLRLTGVAAKLAAFKKIQVDIDYDGATSGSHTVQVASGAAPDGTAANYTQTITYGTGSGTGSAATTNAGVAGFWGTGNLAQRRYRRRRMLVSDLAAARLTVIKDVGSDFDATGGATTMDINGTLIHLAGTAYDGLVFNFASLGAIVNGRVTLTGIN